ARRDDSSLPMRTLLTAPSTDDGGPLLEPSAAVSKRGTHYWEFSWESTWGPRSMWSMPVWGSELPSFIAALARLAGMRFDHAAWPADGQDPVQCLLTAPGGLIWCVSVRRMEIWLALRRMSGSFRTSHDDERHFTAYFQWDRRGRFPREVRVPWAPKT